MLLLTTTKNSKEEKEKIEKFVKIWMERECNTEKKQKRISKEDFDKLKKWYKLL